MKCDWMACVPEEGEFVVKDHTAEKEWVEGKVVGTVIKKVHLSHRHQESGHPEEWQPGVVH